MLKRFSSTLRRDKKKDDTSTNGDVPAKRPNGVHRKSSSFAFPKRERKEPDPPEPDPQQENDTNVFDQFAQLIHAGQRPLPTQTGDGSYIEHEVSTGMWQDLKALGFKDMNTLKDVMANKVSGTYQDDKTYIMERVIQVS